jgi:hypothetical protein
MAAISESSSAENGCVALRAATMAGSWRGFISGIIDLALVTHCLDTMRERRFKRIHNVITKIDAAATDEDAAQFDEELLEAIFGSQKRTSKRA